MSSIRLVLRRSCVALALVAGGRTSEALALHSCDVVFRLADDVTLGSLQWATDYSGTNGWVLREGQDPACENLVQGALYGTTLREDDQIVDQGMISLDGFTGPLDLKRCTFIAPGPFGPNALLVAVEEASDPDLNTVFPLPSVTVDTHCEALPCGNGIVEEGEECDDGNPSDADSCLITCLEATCGDGFLHAGIEECDDGNLQNDDACPGSCKPAACGDGYVRSGVEECDDGNTSSGDGCSSQCTRSLGCGDPTGDGKILAGDALRVLQRAVGLDVDCATWLCDVDGLDGVTTGDALRILRLSVDLPAVVMCGPPTAVKIRIASPAFLGALQFNVGYSNVAGELDGNGEFVLCEVEQAGVEAAFNDKDTQRQLSASFVSIAGIRGPASLAKCSFAPSGDVRPEDFSVVVLDAQKLNGTPAAFPVVRVSPD